ncbi:MAG: SDR family oxidoreductase [Syntrophales bacterium]|jgi:NAD(P)-dependent dehydrogenase (short-subunit alcohol dehydrogenase family)|nr:SDR family oxidoreductase [Syntrophales bacterium]MDD4340037.1 SDR family NAD(P)-dependent oxidoreductase [Syntrophales bacterium]HOG07698.1 SDR family oxidoreductase [Syntrophales bacterium]HOS76996.1 SDR family oxidoreductase [Syntrophales bacterium]HPB70822.1 SDR family oxidoreductase [Syntrophales bacterium]
MQLKGRKAFITGGDRGIGKGIALALAREGADIGLSYRKNREAAETTVREIETAGRRALAVQADVTEPEQVRAAVETVLGQLGAVDILVSNAGIASRGRFIQETDPEEMLCLFNIHVMGAFHVTQALLPVLRQQPRSDIVFISSVGSHKCAAGHGPYAAAKAGLDALAMVLAKEELANRIHVNCLACGLVETDMGAKLVRGAMGAELKDISKDLPFGRVCQPADVGHLCAFLCSEKGSYLSGHIIWLDGGIQW